MSDFELNEAPSDGISSLSYSKYQNQMLLVTSWDSKSRIYDTYANQLLNIFDHDGAVLDGKFISDSQIVCGGLDTKLVLWDIYGPKREILSHDSAIKSICVNESHGIVFSGSWDSSFKAVDLRSSYSVKEHVSLPERVYCMDTVEEKLVIGMADRHVYVFDVRSMKEPIQKRESSLKFQTRTLACIPQGDGTQRSLNSSCQGFVSSSIEGRVAVDFFDPSASVQAKKYAFKCHRSMVEGTESIYPVNAISFHPTYGTFATGGSDGSVHVWDRVNKKKIKSFPKYPTTIAALSFSNDGNSLAIASSYTYDEGPKDHAPDTVYIKSIQESDVLSKSK